MALSVSGFGQALDYKIVHESAAGTTVNNNVTQSSGTLLAVTIDNTAGTHACSLKIYDGVAPTVGSTLPDLILCHAVETDWRLQLKREVESTQKRREIHDGVQEQNNPTLAILTFFRVGFEL